MFKHADIQTRRAVAGLSLGIFGVISLVTGSASIFILGLVPIVVFTYVLHR